jgi:hypothetical protein
MSWVSRLRRTCSASLFDDSSVDQQSVLGEIMAMCASEHDCSMCVYVCETHGIDPSELVSHWRERLQGMADPDQRVASERLLDSLCLELRARREGWPEYNSALPV